jgi:hypothetical protein
MNQTQACAASESLAVPDAAPSVENPEPEPSDTEIEEAEPKVPPRKRLRNDVMGLSELESRDAETDREEPEAPSRKKLRNDVKDLSERVDAVEKTCAEVKTGNTATSAEVARLKECVSELESDRESDIAAVRNDLDDIRTKLTCVTGLCPTFNKFSNHRDDILTITVKASNFPRHEKFAYFLARSVAFFFLRGFDTKNE